MRDRREFPAKIRAAAFERAAGCCERCTAKLMPGHFAYDHIVADSIGGEPTLDNCAVLCSGCHGEKTRTLDTPRAAKTKRQRNGHIGAKVRRPWHPTLRKKMDGSVVARGQTPGDTSNG